MSMVSVLVFESFLAFLSFFVGFFGAMSILLN